jgi:hypothetical protein
MRAQEFLYEYRDKMYQYLKSIVPTWPDYIVKDWLYANFAKGETYNKEKGWSFETIGKDIPKILNDMGLSVDTNWQLVPNVKFTMDMWEPKTLKRLQARASGNAKSADPVVHIPARDAERHATQAALAKQQGGVRKEPVILVKTANGYELLEGWHRTIQHFHMYPDGYTGPAYVAVAVAQGQQGVAEDISRRGFLKGAGAMAAGISAAGGARADNQTDPNKLIAIVNINGESKEFNLTGRFKGDVKSQLHQAEKFITEFLEKRDINFSNLELRYQRAVLKTQNIGSVKEEQGMAEARRNPEQNTKYGMGKFELAAFAEDIRDKENWGVSMTVEPKLGINPQVGISEDTPKGIYFYPLEYFIQMVNRYQPLPWGDNMPYMQLFQYDRSGEMTKQTEVDSVQLRQALSQYCPEEVIQQVLDEPDQLYDGTPYWTIYDALSRLGKGDETNIVRWNKVLRDLGFTSVYDPGAGWIAYGEPTQGVVLDPRIIKQHKMFVNRNPKVKARQYDVQELADAIMYNGDYDRERQRQRIAYGDPAEVKARLDVAKSMLRPFLGKTEKEAKEMGLDQAIKTAGEKVIEILKPSVTENFADGKNPGRKGLAKRSGVNTKASVSSLRKTAKNSSGEKQRMAHWLANMKAGRAKAKRK